MRIARRLAVLGSAFLLTLGLMSTMSAGTASASSMQCIKYGTQWHGVGVNTFCAYLRGRGTTVDTIQGTFGNLPLCAASMKVDFWRADGKFLTWRQGPRRGDCAGAGAAVAPQIDVYWDFPALAGHGRAVVTLQSRNQDVTSTTFDIH